MQWIHQLSEQGSRDNGKEPPCSVKGREFAEQVSDFQLLKKACDLARRLRLTICRI
jgi:hypothetical protein